MWWPSPEGLEDLVVEDVEDGFDLSAPDGTECADWLSYWDQSEEHHLLFQKEFERTLLDYLDTLQQHGKTEAIPDQQSGPGIQAEEDGPGTLA